MTLTFAQAQRFAFRLTSACTSEQKFLLQQTLLSENNHESVLWYLHRQCRREIELVLSPFRVETEIIPCSGEPRIAYTAPAEL